MHRASLAVAGASAAAELSFGGRERAPAQPPLSPSLTPFLYPHLLPLASVELVFPAYFQVIFGVNILLL